MGCATLSFVSFRNINKITSVDNRVKNRERAEDNIKEQRESGRFRA